MIQHLLAVILFIAITIQAAPFPHAKTTADDVNNQLGKKIQCWQGKKEKHGTPENYYLSEPIYDACTYVWGGQGTIAVSGTTTEEQSQDYPFFQNIFSQTEKTYGITVVCMQEALQFFPNHPNEIAVRCLCHRSGCNVLKGIHDLFHLNQKPISL